MAINKMLLEKKLAVLKDFLLQIDSMDFKEQGLLEEKDVQQLLSFRLQQAVETAIDITTHLIAGLDLDRQETAKDAFDVLQKEGIISKSLAEGLGSACGFRNLVVHGYQKIDFKRLFYDYKKDLSDLRAFAQKIYDFLKKKNT